MIFLCEEVIRGTGEAGLRSVCCFFGLKLSPNFWWLFGRAFSAFFKPFLRYLLVFGLKQMHVHKSRDKR